MMTCHDSVSGNRMKVLTQQWFALLHPVPLHSFRQLVMTFTKAGHGADGTADDLC